MSYRPGTPPTGTAAGHADTEYRRAPLSRRTSAQAETFPRQGAALTNLSILVSGSEAMFMLEGTRAGQLVSTVTFYSGTTALATGVNQWFTLRDASFNLLAITADDTTNAWAAQAEKTLTLASPYTLPGDGPYYIGCMVKATTVPSLMGVVNGSPALLRAINPVVAGISTSASNTNPASAASPLVLSNIGGQAWGWVG